MNGDIYGCWNRKPFKDFHIVGRVVIRHVMTRDCQYTKSELGQRDDKCVGCKHKENK